MGDAYYADGTYAGIYGSPGDWWDGTYYYWYDDLWWYRYGDRWVILHDEPQALYQWRANHWGYRPYGGYYRARPYYRGGPMVRAPYRPHVNGPGMRGGGVRGGGPRGGGRGRR